MNILNQSKDFKSEYCATIVKIGNITPIEGTDNLATTEIEGRVLVVNKHQIKEGDLRVYFSNECEICDKILHELSMYDDKTLNKDPSIKGYVSKTGRVRMIKLKGQISMGLTFPVEDLVQVYPNLKDYNFSNHIEEDFDSVDGEVIVKAYIPKNIKGFSTSNQGSKKNNRLKIDIVPEEFKFHYDTEQLQRCMDEFYPDDEVTLSVKQHGTSMVIGNLKCRVPRWKGLYTKYFNLLPKFLKKYKYEYRIIYSSRSVIKNGKLNSTEPNEIWKKAYEKVKDLIPKNETWYCEIVGYDGNTMIQKNYDYGCKVEEFKIIVYRIHDYSTSPPIKFAEFNVSDIKNNWVNDGWALSRADKYCSYLKTPEILYVGKMRDLYPEIKVPELYDKYKDYREMDADDSNKIYNELKEWRHNVLNAMKNDKERFGMELDEPLCKNKVPREGIVVRKNDGSCKAWKLKSLKFLGKEAEAVDKGEVNFE